MAVDGNSLYPMTASPTAGRKWQSKLFTSSATWTVPADVGCIWVDGCGGGGGGGGGDATPGGGGGGGGSGIAATGIQVGVSPGEIISLVIGSAGTGGPAGSDGTDGGYSDFIATSYRHRFENGHKGLKGANPAGGNGGMAGAYVSEGGVGGAGNSNGGSSTITDSVHIRGYGPAAPAHAVRCLAGSGGGGYSAGSGGTCGNPYATSTYDKIVFGGSGGANGGGGGSGGNCGEFGFGGQGGSNGAAGANATGYGAGGGGGSGNSAGGNGAPGMIRIYCFTAYAI